MKNLYIFTDSFLPIDNTTSYYLNGIVDALNDEKKFKINIYFIGNKPLPKIKKIKNINYRRIKYPKFNKNNLLLKNINFLLISLIFSFISIIKVKKSETILLTTNPPFMLLSISIIKKIKKFKTVLLVYDIFPENTIAANIIKKKSFFYKILLKFFSISYDNMDYLIAIGREMESYLGNKYGYQKVKFIPNWSNIDDIEYINKNKLELQKELSDKFIFQFAGNLGRVQELNLIFDAIKLVKNNKIVFLFIGDGVMKNKLINLIQNNSNKNIIYLGRKEFNQQNKFLPISDVGIVSLKKEVFMFGVPSKSYAYLAAGRPILFIGHNGSETGRMIDDNNIGWKTSTDSPDILAKLFDTISQKLNIEDKSIHVRKIAETVYSPKIIKENYISFLIDII